MSKSLGDHGSLDLVDEASTWPEHIVDLPSGRTFDLTRSRWDGVLDREEYEYCRAHGIPLGYDCAQIGWVIQASADVSNEPPEAPMIVGATALATTSGSETQALELRELIAKEAARMLVEVRQGGRSLEDAQEGLVLTAAIALKGFAAEFGLSDCDLAHWVLESAAVNVLGELRERRTVSETSTFGFRPWSLDDASVYAELLGNPTVWEHLPEPFPSEFTVDTARTLIEVSAIGFHHDTVAIEVEGRPIGQCRLRFDRPFAGTRAAEVSYWLGQEHWGLGWMSRVLPAFTHRAFLQHPTDVIYAWIMRENTASIRVAESAGYRRAPFPLEAQLAESLRRPGFVRYATHRVDWTADAELRP